MEEETLAANEAVILERRDEIRSSLRAVENSLREAGAVTHGYNSAYLLESPAAHWNPTTSLFRRTVASLTSSAAFRFDFDAPDAVRLEWRLSPLGEAKCRKILTLFDADEDERWTHEEFLEYMAALQCSSDSVELRAFEESAEVWGMYMSDMCELDEEGRLTFQGFVMYREQIEDEQPLTRDLASLGISLEWEELERVEMMKQLFDAYVDDPTGSVTAKAAQYLLAESGFVLTGDETAEIIGKRYELARCLRFIHQLKRTLRLFGYRQKSALRFTNEGHARSEHNEEQPRICKVGFLSLMSSSWCPAVKTVAAATLHELKYLERGAECFMYIDFACRSGTKDSDAQILVDRLTWFLGDFFRDHIESLPFFHRWFVTLPTKPQLRMGPSSSGTPGPSSPVVRLVILFTGEMDLYHVMQSLGLPSSMQFDHLLQRFSLRWLCSHSLEDLLVAKNLNLGSHWSCRTQMDLRLNRQAWAQIISQVAYQLEADLAHEREDAEYIAQVKAEREQKKKKSVVLNQRRQSVSTQPNNQHDNLHNSQCESSNAESSQHLLIKSLHRVAYALKHSQQLSSAWAFTNLGAALRENQWLRSVLSPQWLELLTHVLETPGGLAGEWKAKGDSLRAEFADTSYAMAGAARQVLGHHTLRPTGSSNEFTLAPFAAAAMKNPPTSRVSETPKLTARHSHIQHDPNHSTNSIPEAPEEKSTEYLLLEFYDLCARHLQGVRVVRAEAGTSGVTCILEGWNIFSLLPRIHQGHLMKKASLVRSGTFTSWQPHSSRSTSSGMGH
ncbi:hypothetical protein PRIC2_014102 [Phytophthora ramorum]